MLTDSYRALWNKRVKTMEKGKAYTEADLANMPKIRPDGSVDSPDVISPEQAALLDTGNTNAIDAAVIELEPEQTKTSVPSEVAKKDPPAEEKGIVLEEESAKADEVIRIGGEEIRKSDLLKEAEAFAKVDLSNAAPETKEAVIQMYADHKHKSAWQKSNTQKAEENAHVRRANEAQKAEIEHRRRTLVNQQKMLKEQEAKLRALASKEMTEQEAEESVSKTREFNKIMDARERLPEIETQLQVTQQEMAQADIDRTLADVEALIAVHPEYRFAESQSLREAMKRFEEGSKSDEDADRVQDIYDVIDAAREHGTSIERAFDRLMRKGALTVTATKPNLPNPKSRTTETEKMAAAIAEKQKRGAQFLDPATAANERSVAAPKITLGDKLRDAALRARGLNANPVLDKSGY